MELLISKNISYDKEQFAPENELVLSKVKMQKLYTNCEKFNCDQCNCTNLSEKWLAQHMRKKNCDSMDF